MQLLFNNRLFLRSCSFLDNNINQYIEKMQKLNIFPIGNFWKTQIPTLSNNRCGSIVSIIILSIIGILFVLKFIALVSLNSVFWTEDYAHDIEPVTTSFSTNPNDSGYTQFMIGFGIINDATCASSINFQAYANTIQTSPQASTSRLPINLQACTDVHFSKLPGRLTKLRSWTQRQLYCLPLNSYFQFGGSSSISSVYKSLSFNFNCPASCPAATCASIEMYTQNTKVNVQNTTEPFSYYLDRKLFTIYNAPTFQNIYQLQASSLTTDRSILSFSLNSEIHANSMGQFINDVASTNPSTTILTIQRSDKTVLYRRSYLKLFDLFAYIGGVIQAFLILFMFMRAIARLEFEIKFAGEYFRTNDFKNYQFTSYVKLLFYGFLRAFKCKMDWKMAQKSQQTKQLVNKLFNVVYLNKRIAFLEEAISVLLKEHQLKGIHLLHSLSKEKTEKDIRELKYRDRMVYFLNKKVRHDKNGEKKSDKKNKTHSYPQNQNLLTKKGPNEISQMERAKINDPNGNNVSCSIGGELRSGGQILNNQQKIGRVSYKMILEQKENKNQAKQNLESQGALIINQAEEEFGSQSLSDEFVQPVVHNAEDIKKLKAEADFVGFMSVEELNQPEIATALETDLKMLVNEAQNNNGDQISRRIYQKLDVWLKNQLKNVMSRRHQGGIINQSNSNQSSRE